MAWTDFPCVITGRTTTAHLHWARRYGKVPKGLYVCHRCDNRYCKQLEHLFLGTPQDNTRDAIQKGRFRFHPENLTPHHPQVGEKNGRAILTPDDVRAIRAHPERAGVDIAFDLGVTPSLVCAIRKGRVWKSVV